MEAHSGGVSFLFLNFPPKLDRDPPFLAVAVELPLGRNPSIMSAPFASSGLYFYQLLHISLGFLCHLLSLCILVKPVCLHALGIHFVAQTLCKTRNTKTILCPYLTVPPTA